MVEVGRCRSLLFNSKLEVKGGDGLNRPNIAGKCPSYEIPLSECRIDTILSTYILSVIWIPGHGAIQEKIRRLAKINRLQQIK